MPKVIKKRTEKKAHHEEGIKETVYDIRDKIKERQRALVYALVIFLAVVVSVAGFAIYYSGKKGEAHEYEIKGYRSYHGEFLSQPMNPDERYKQALEFFKKSYKAKKNPNVLMYIANCQYELGDYDKAIATLRELNTHSLEPGVISLLFYKLSMAHLKKGEEVNAMESLKRIGSIKDGPLKDLALFERGRILEGMQKGDDAAAVYKELAEKFPASPFAAVAQDKTAK